MSEEQSSDYILRDALSVYTSTDHYRMEFCLSNLES